jgi:hypothetical protein
MLWPLKIQSREQERRLGGARQLDVRLLGSKLQAAKHRRGNLYRR